MLDEALEALALTGGTTVVAAMATDAWQSTRAGVARLFRRSGPAQQTIVEGQLDGNAALVTQSEHPERARERLIPLWQEQLEMLLRQDTDAEAELRALIAHTRALLPREQHTWVQTVTTRNNSQAFFSQTGNVVVHNAPPNSSSLPISPADAHTDRVINSPRDGTS